jgi:hypothetical protein
MGLRRLVIVFVGALIVYALTFSFRPTTDTQLNSLQTRQLALHGNVDLASYHPVAGFYVAHDNHTYSIYGTGISIFSLPLYALLVRASVGEPALQGIVACSASALAFVLMLFLLLRVVPRSIAIAGSIVFGFGTTIWTTASTALWQSGPVVALETLGLLGLFSDGPWGPVLAGFSFGAAAFIRLPIAAIAGLFLLYYLTQNRRRCIQYVAGLLPFLVGRLIENGWLWGGLTHTGYSFEAGTFMFSNFKSGLWGELFSWRRGLLVYSPIVLVAAVGLILFLLRFRSEKDRRPFFLALATLLVLAINAAHSVWWGGERQFGYRYLIDAVPFLVVVGALQVERWRSARAFATLLGLMSIIFMAAGSSPNLNAWDTTFQQNHLSLSPLTHALGAMRHHPVPALWRLGLVGALTLFLIAATKHVRSEAAEIGTPQL